MVDFYLQAIYTLTGILSYISLSTASGTLESSSNHAEEDVCRYFVPMSDTICGLQSADNSLARSEALYQAIHGKYSPDKSSDDEFTEISQKRLFLGDFLQKQTLLDKVQRIVDAAQSTVQNERKDVCRYIAPISNTICGLQSAGNSLARNEALNQAIHDKYSPGKRSDDEFMELSQKRLKRSCNLNLGLHCQTEQYSVIADMYNWLQSSLSPGKRRRRDTRGKPGPP